MFSRCSIPGMLNDTYQIQNEAHACAINGTIPADDTGLYPYSRCGIYADNTTTSCHPPNNTNIRHCDSWVFDKSQFSTTITGQVGKRSNKYIRAIKKRNSDHLLRRTITSKSHLGIIDWIYMLVNKT